jgi:hypothetical protein
VTSTRRTRSVAAIGTSLAGFGASIALSKIENYILPVDTRDTPEQAELRRAARRLAREMGPAAVSDLDDATRAKRLAVAVGDAGWLELRSDAGDGVPVAGGVEAAIIADALGAAAADVAFTGPTLAADLARRAGCNPTPDAVVAFTSSLTEPAVMRGPETTSALVAVDGAGHDSAAYVLVPEISGSRSTARRATRTAAPISHASCARSRREHRCTRSPTSVERSPMTTSPPGLRSGWL